MNIKIEPQNLEAFMGESTANARAARREAACLQFDVLVDKDDPTRVMLYEVYRDEAAFEVHHQTPHFKHHTEHGVPLLESRVRSFMKRHPL